MDGLHIQCWSKSKEQIFCLQPSVRFNANASMNGWFPQGSSLNLCHDQEPGLCLQHQGFQARGFEQVTISYAYDVKVSDTQIDRQTKCRGKLTRDLGSASPEEADCPVRRENAPHNRETYDTWTRGIQFKLLYSWYYKITERLDCSTAGTLPSVHASLLLLRNDAPSEREART